MALIHIHHIYNPYNKNKMDTNVSIFGKYFKASTPPYSHQIKIVAPITYDNEIEISIAINPTARLSFTSSSSILKMGVKNSNKKYATSKITNPNIAHT